MNQKGHVFLDPQRAPVIKELFIKVAHQGYSGRKIVRWLKEISFVTKSGKPLSLSNIYLILNNHFYHGTFEYPKNSGRWFQGKHIPIITRELFEETQKQLQLQRKAKGKNKEFSFTRLMFCGLCESGITAQEKYKNLKDGAVAKYIYYGCTRAKDTNCRNTYIEERALIAQLLKLIDKVDLDKSGIKKKLETEIERHKKFHSGIMGKSEEEYSAKDADIRNYAKYLMTEGSLFEKRELMTSLKNKIILKDKKIQLSK